MSTHKKVQDEEKSRPALLYIGIINPMKLTLTLMEQNFTVHRLSADADVPEDILRTPFFAAMRTADELSLVLPETVVCQSDSAEPGWACFKVNGPLEFGLVGILASIAGALAEARIPIFALSTFETDYVLVKREQVEAAKEALTSTGYNIAEG